MEEGATCRWGCVWHEATERQGRTGVPVQGGQMVTRFLVQARNCFEIDPDKIIGAGGRLIGIGRIEDDGTCTVDVDVTDLDANRRLGALFASNIHN
jgi:hypothetical protein